MSFASPSSESSVNSNISLYLNQIEVSKRTKYDENEAESQTDVSQVGICKSVPICRICYSKPNVIPTPCNCVGSIGYIHKQCLRKWIRILKNDVCEICHQKFNGKILGRPRTFKELFMTFLKRPFWVGMRTLINFLSFSGLGFMLSRQLLMVIDIINKEDHVTMTIDILFPTLLTLTGIFFYFVTNWTIVNVREFIFTLNIWWNNNWIMDDNDETIDYTEEDRDNMNDVINWNHFNLVILNSIDSFDLGNI